MATLEKAIIDMYAEYFVKEIVSIIKQPENIKILWDAYNELPHNIDFFRKGSYAVMPHSALPLFLEEVNKELSEMLGMDSCLRFKENLCIIQNDSERRSYFHPLVYREDYELCPVIGICAEDMNEYALYPTVAHELVHFFQDCRNHDANLDWNNFKFLKEGFARGVERIIAQNEARRKRKSVFVNTTLERLYEDITEFASNGYKKDAEKQLHYEGHWGSCAFVIAEARHGKGIYKEMMQSDKPYEMLVEMLGGGQ
ncbi:MAG: hypothetical protein WC852_01010 [Candidatus Nanoarchaeia archaeon]|jgi:hypothetical protein